MKSFFKSKHFIVKAIIISAILLITGLSFFFADKIEIALHLRSYSLEFERSESEIFASDYYVSYIDVGQGNCTFVKLPDGKTMLVDGGNTMYGEKVTNFLMKHNVTTIDYMIATHADADHIGGLVSVLENFEVKNIYRPFQISGIGSSYATFVPNEKEDLAGVYNYYVQNLGNSSKISRVTTNVYKNFITLAYSETYMLDGKSTNSNITVFYDGLVVSGNGYSFEFYSPLLREEKLDLLLMSNTVGFATVGYGATSSNDNSAIFLLECLGSTYLFTGDAPCTDRSGKTNGFEETDFINSLSELEKERLANVSVYLVGHHGSVYSSSLKLLNLISPKFAVISVAKKNDYGHPSSETVKRLKNLKSLSKDNLLMTSSSGTITFTGSDKSIVFATEVKTNNSKFEISWYLLSSIFAVTIIVIVISIKPRVRKSKPRASKNFVDSPK